MKLILKKKYLKLDYPLGMYSNVSPLITRPSRNIASFTYHIIYMSFKIYGITICQDTYYGTNSVRQHN